MKMGWQIGAIASFLMCACSPVMPNLSALSPERSPIEFLPVFPDANIEPQEIVFDVGNGKKTPYEIRAQIQWGSSRFKTQALNDPSDVLSFRLYLINGNVIPAEPVVGGGPFVLDVNPVLGSTYPKTKILVFKNVPDNTSHATYRVAAAAFDAIGGLGTNITGNGTAATGYIFIDEDGGGCPTGCQDAFHSIGGGNSVTDFGEVQVMPAPAFTVTPGHESPLLIFMTLD